MEMFKALRGLWRKVASAARRSRGGYWCDACGQWTRRRDGRATVRTTPRECDVPDGLRPGLLPSRPMRDRTTGATLQGWPRGPIRRADAVELLCPACAAAAPVAADGGGAC